MTTIIRALAAALLSVVALGGCAQSDPATSEGIQGAQVVRLIDAWNSMDVDQKFTACNMYSDADMAFWIASQEYIASEGLAPLGADVFANFYAEACGRLGYDS